MAETVEEAEARLGVRLPEAYRAFASDRRRYRLQFKHQRLFPLARCEWANDARTELVIGSSGDAHPLVLVARKTTLSGAVYEKIDGRRVRRPDFAEWIEDTRPPEIPTLSSDERVRHAERLAGLARRCRCGAEVRIQQRCPCGRIGSLGDPPVEAVRDEKLADIERAWDAISSLKKEGRTVPAGPAAVVALADALVAGSIAAVIATWRSTGMKVDVEERDLRAALAVP